MNGIRKPRAFLSHSSSDKHLVEPVFDKLTGLRAEFDVVTFRDNERISSEIRFALDRCNVFVLFASPRSLQSPWVQEEINLAISRRQADSSFRLAVFCIDGTTYRDLPPEMQDIVAPEYTTSHGVASRIHDLLLECGLSPQWSSEPFIGRSDDEERFSRLVLPASQEIPGAVIVSGLHGIGRRTFCRWQMKRHFPWVSSSPLEIRLSAADADFELYRQLLVQGHPRSLGDLSRQLQKYSATVQLVDRIEILAALLVHMTERNQYILVLAKDCIVDEGGAIEDWVVTLAHRLKNSHYPRLLVATARHPNAVAVSGTESVRSIRLGAIGAEDSFRLYSIWVKQLEPSVKPTDVRFLHDACEGNPMLVRRAAHLVAFDGVATVNASRARYVGLVSNESEQIIRSAGLGRLGNDVLAVVNDLGSATLEEVFVALETSDAGGSRGKIAGTISELLAHGLVEDFAGSLEIPKFLAFAINRTPKTQRVRSLLDSARAKLSKAVLKLNDGSYVPRRLLSGIAVAALDGQGKVGWLDGVLSPAQLLRAAQRAYDDRRYQRAGELLARAVSQRHLLSSAGNLEAFKLLGRIAIRLDDDYKFSAAIEGIEAAGSDRGHREASAFLKGFRCRVRGDVSGAERNFQIALSLGRKRNVSVLRELAAISLEKGRFSEAEAFARDGMKNSPGNPFLLDILVDALIHRTPAEDLDDCQGELTKLIAALDELDQREGKVFARVRQAQILLKKGDLKAALSELQSAERRSARFVPAMLMQGKVLCSLEKFNDAGEVLGRIEEVCRESFGAESIPIGWRREVSELKRRVQAAGA